MFWIIIPLFHYSILGLFHPQGFNHIHFSSPSGRDETCTNGGKHHYQPGFDEAPERDGELNGPSKGLFIDNVDEKNGEEKTADEAQDVAEKTNHPRLDQRRLLDLLSKCTHSPDDSDIPLPINDQCIQGVDNSKNGHDDGDELKGIGDGEGLIKDLQDFFTQFAMGDHKEAIRF